MNGPFQRGMWLRAVFVLTFVLGSSGPARANPPAEAGEPEDAGLTETKTSTAGGDATRFAEEARSLYKEGKYLEALDAFRMAYAIAPTPALAYNIARCHERLSQWQEALTMYERYASEATDPRDRAEALEKIELLKTKVGADRNAPDAKYQARLEAGRKAYARGDYEGAIVEFKAAFDLKPTGGALYNIGKSYEKMARYEEAIDFLTQYLELDPNVADKSDVEELIRRLKKSLREKFQELSVSSDPPGADIYLDDRNSGLQGQTNYRFKVTPGPHTLYLDLNGYEPTKRDFAMPDDKPLALDFKLKKLENVGFLDIKVSQDGARIFVDGAIIGLSPYRDKKALPAGSHQVQVEAVGFLRSTKTVAVLRDQTTPVVVDLEAYVAPVEDETLSKWGRNLLAIGIVAGGLGFGGPFAYQKLILRRDPFTQLGPSEPTERAVYRGPLNEGDPALRRDSTHQTLKAVQLWSLIGGSVFSAAGVGFYLYKWFRATPPKPVTASITPPEPGSDMPAPPPAPTITRIAVDVNDRGTTLGLFGSF